ncbi:MAG: IS30 family transposase [Clostridia bacterium]|nr:IS30 family transposase [Clostridia bacterium]
MNRYTHFTIEEREKARCLLEHGLSIRAIARILKRSPSSVSREFKRNSYKNGVYAAHHAQKLYSKRKKQCGKTPKLLDETIKSYVLERMELRWTPEQICERAKLEKQPFSLSFVTIYRAIDNGVLPRQLKKIMRFKWKYKKRKTSDKRGKIQNTVSIHDRPESANNRTEAGHWESDTVLGKRKTGCFGTHVERVSGYLVAFYLTDRKDRIFNRATVDAFKEIPTSIKKSFTVDNGKEFTHHQELAKQTDMSVYFCDPHAPWQRGTNENTNGLIRQFFPKGTSLANVSQDDLNDVVNLINNRPRKRLGWRTPTEVINSILHRCCT